MRGLERYAPLSGFLAVALWIVGVFVCFQNEPGDKASGADYAAWFNDHTVQILVGASLIFYGLAAFVWFAASLRAWVLAAEGPVGRLATLTFAGAFGYALAVMAAFAPTVSGALRADSDEVISPDMANVFYSAGDGFILAAMAMTVVLFIAVGLATLRFRTFPLWFGIISFLLALAALIPPIGWAVVIFGVPLWTLIAAGLLTYRTFRPALPARRAPPSPRIRH